MYEESHIVATPYNKTLLSMDWTELIQNKYTKTIWSDYHNGTFTETHKNLISEIQIIYDIQSQYVRYFSLISAKLTSGTILYKHQI